MFSGLEYSSTDPNFGFPRRRDRQPIDNPIGKKQFLGRWRSRSTAAAVDLQPVPGSIYECSYGYDLDDKVTMASARMCRARGPFLSILAHLLVSEALASAESSGARDDALESDLRCAPKLL